MKPLKGENSPVPAPYTTTPTSYTTTPTPYTTRPTPVLNDSCILPPTRDYGKLGDPCRCNFIKFLQWYIFMHFAVTEII